MILSDSMNRALVVKTLTDQIILVRMDSGNLLCLSVPCRTISPGILLSFDSESLGCPVQSVGGRNCKSVCHRQKHVMIIEHKDRESSTLLPTSQDANHHAV